MSRPLRWLLPAWPARRSAIPNKIKQVVGGHQQNTHINIKININAVVFIVIIIVVLLLLIIIIINIIINININNSCGQQTTNWCYSYNTLWFLVSICNIHTSHVCITVLPQDPQPWRLNPKPFRDLPEMNLYTWHLTKQLQCPLRGPTCTLKPNQPNYSKKIQDSNDVSENEFYTILPVWKVSVIFLQVESCCFAKGLCLEA